MWCYSIFLYIFLFFFSAAASHLVVIDAGSSKTAVSLYKWSPTSDPILVTDCSNKTDGIDQFEDNPSMVAPYLRQCIEEVLCA